MACDLADLMAMAVAGQTAFWLVVLKESKKGDSTVEMMVS